MTTLEIVAAFHAKRVAKGKWMARCPVHGRDRSPSLSIRTGTKGANAIIYCFAGCDSSAVLGAVGLKLRDLYPDTKPDREAMALADKMRAETARERLKELHLLSRIIDLRNQWARRRNRLGKLLMEQSSSDTLNSKFHRACSMSRSLDESAVALMCKRYKFHEDNFVTGEL